MNRASSATDSAQSLASSSDRAPKAIIAAGFVSALGIGLFSFILPLLSLDDRISGAWIGSVFALYFAAKLAASPVSGLWSDKSGPRRPMLASALIGVAAPLAYLLAPTLPVLYAVQMALGLAGGLMRPAALAALASSLPDARRSQWFGLNSAAFNIAVFLGPLLGGLLYWSREIQPVVWGLCGCMLLSAATILLIPPVKTTSAPASADAPSRPTAPRKDLGALLLAIGGRALGIGTVTAFYPILLAQTLAFNGLKLALVFSAASLTSCVGLPVFGKLLAGKNERLLTGVGILLSSVALFALGLCRESWQFVAAGCAIGLGASISAPPSMVLAARLSPSKGGTFGAAQATVAVGLLVGPMLGGAAAAWGQNVGSALELAAIGGVALCLPILFSGLKRIPGWGASYFWLSACTGVLLLAVMAATTTIAGHQNRGGGSLHRFAGVAMGTLIKLTIEAPNEIKAKDAADSAMSLIRELQKDLDYRNPQGSIAKINLNAGGRSVRPSPLAFELLQRSLDFSAKTDGVFDPTIGALTTSPIYFALDDQIARKDRKFVDYRLVRLQPATGGVRLEKKGMALDLGGIAKGAIIDAAVAALRELGVKAGVVEAGGDFYCFGDRDWRVGIRNPRGSGILGAITVREKGVCGSGDYQRFVMVEQGQSLERRHHIIDPRTMHSAGQSIGVTVVADNAEQADALATTLFIMGPAKGQAFLQRYYPNASAQWVGDDLNIVDSQNFPAAVDVASQPERSVEEAF
ncbi:MAG: MFS transporter [Desulfovibrionaceae bacterium]